MRVPYFLALGISVSSIVRACATDEDCSLNGLCVREESNHEDHCKARNICKCDLGWFGDDCGRLDLAPARRGIGYNHTDATNPSYYGNYGNSSWGGQILQDRDDSKLFHLFASQFGHGCGLSGWRPHSFVIRAESRSGPQGPYQYAQTVTQAFHHNPYVFWSEADQKYLLYATGIDTSEPNPCKSISYTQWPNNISVSAADDIRGPWTPFKLILNSKEPHSTNPAPFPLWTPQNQTSQIMLAVEDNAYYIADKWDGNYTLVKTQSWNTSEFSPTWTEDPFVWRDKRGNWHSINHWLIDLVEHDRRQWPRVGVHMFSRSLTGNWHFTPHEAFNSSVNFDDDSIQTLKRRERPKIFFSDDGEMTPLYLINGVQNMWERGNSYTFIQPIGTKWKEYEKSLGF